MAFVKSRKTKRGLTFHLLDNVNGKWISMKLPVYTMREAEVYRKKYEGDRADNRPNSLFMEKVNFREFVEKKYLVISKSFKTEKTYYVDGNQIRLLYKQFGDLFLHEITAERVAMFQAESFKNGLTKKTINNRTSLLGTILRTAYKQGALLKVPEIKPLKLDVLPPKAFSMEDEQAILDTAKKWPDKSVYDFVMVFLNSGMRLAELQYLKWEDVDLMTKQLMVKLSKSHKFRAIPLNHTLEAHFRALIAKKTATQVYVFEYEGQPFDDDLYYARFKRLLKVLNIDGCIHSLRHTFASRLVQQGVSLYHVQRLLGHSTIKTTERYSHLRSIDLAKAVQTLDAIGTVSEPRQIVVLKTA